MTLQRKTIYHKFTQHYLSLMIKVVFKNVKLYNVTYHTLYIYKYRLILNMFFLLKYNTVYNVKF